MKNLILILTFFISFTLKGQFYCPIDSQGIHYNAYAIALYPQNTFIDIDSFKVFENHIIIPSFNLDNDMNLFVDYYVGIKIHETIFPIYEFVDIELANNLLKLYKPMFPNAVIVTRNKKY